MIVVSQVLPWILPPILGAIIGYVTNAIAIRMLFRPFNEIRVFGVKLPFTPGLIPRQRGDLAESMARMVSTELLTVEAVRNQVRSPGFSTAIERNVAALTTQLLATRIKDMGGALTARVDGEHPPGAVESFGTLIQAALSGFARSEGFASLVRSLVAHLVDTFAERPVGEVLKGEGAAALLGRLLEGLGSAERRGQIRSRVSEWIAVRLAENTQLSQYISADDTDAIAGLVDRIYPSIAELIMKWLRSDGMKRELAVRGRFLVQDIVDRLTGIQRLIISAAQYQRTLDQNMGAIVSDAVGAVEEALSDPSNRKRVVETIRREIESARERGIGDLAKNHEEAVKNTAAVVADRAIGALSQPDIREGVIGLVSGPAESESIGALLGRLLHLEGESPGDFIAGLIFPASAPAAGAAGGLADTIQLFFRRFIDTHAETGLGELLAMDGPTKERLDGALSATLISTVDARAPEILASIDIRDLVVSKINGLDIEEVEGLLLQVIQRHLQYINVFGGILGGLIGLIQDLLRLLHLST